VILFRCFAWNDRAQAVERDGPLWVPREFQGEGRHDNPHVYGCLYLADRAVSAVVEQLARFRGQRLSAALLRRRGLPLAIAELELADRSRLIDLDDPVVLTHENLRPSHVATRDRSITQQQALKLYSEHAGAAGVRWWSTYESLWTHVTLFDRGARQLRLRAVRALTTDDAAVLEAAERFAMRT
jgi:hypothetical protein